MMKRVWTGVLFVATVVALTSTAALAHVGVGVGETSGLATGFLHPILGLDHVLAMVAVGLWAAQLGGRAVWTIPAGFVGAMILGAAAGMVGLHIPFVEVGIVASVMVLGVLVAAAFRAPVAVGAAVVGLFALFHGHAHGTEMPALADGGAYMLGFVLATAALHAVGVAIGTGAQRWSGVATARLAGGAIAAVGALLAFV